MYFAIHVPDAERATAFYTNVFGWTYESGGGDYHHIVGSSPAGGIVGGGDPRIAASFVVGDIREAVATARGSGGTATEPVLSKSGWSATVADGRGGKIDIWQPAEGYADPNPKCAVGDLFYFYLPVADDDAKRFYGDLFGWEYTTGNVPGGWNIADITPPGGLFVGGAGDPALYFQVDDVDTAAARIREAGGTAGPTEPSSAGWHATCHDDQGVSFGVGALRQR